MKKSKKAKPHFNRQEKAILKVLYEERRWLSIKELAEEAHMSWVTANKHLKNLVKKNWVQKEKNKYGKKI